MREAQLRLRLLSLLTTKTRRHEAGKEDRGSSGSIRIWDCRATLHLPEFPCLRHALVPLFDSPFAMASCLERIQTMKVWKIASSVLLILLGFTAGVALRTSPSVKAADPTPPKPLTSVAHDATLNGDGTTGAPLGLANGAVSVAKLSPSRLPSTGQVLGFDGAQLAWKNAPIGGVHVVDSLGHDVGPLVDEEDVLVRSGGLVWILPASVGGFVRAGANGAAIAYLHTTSDCSGTRYLIVGPPGALVAHAAVFSTQLMYAAPPTQQITFHSVEQLVDVDNPDAPTQGCSTGYSNTATVGVRTFVSLSTFGVTPPFHLEF